MSRRYWLETYGCQMNKAESSALSKGLKAVGWEATFSEQEAELILLNTCSVRETAEKRVWGRVGYYAHQKKRHNRNLKLGIVGCMADRLIQWPDKRAGGVDFLIANKGKMAFIRHLEEKRSLEGPLYFDGEEYSFFQDHLKAGAQSALIPIMHGCNNFCSYCIVPHLRGGERSRNPDEIVSEVTRWVSKSGGEVTLLGQNVASYQFTLNRAVTDFARLLQRVATETGIERLRFLSSHPKDFSLSIIETMAQHPNICPSLHLAVQSGSSKILAAMNRQYTRDQFLSLVEVIRKNMPSVALSTDLLVGFPGETETDFKDTLSLVEAVRFQDAYTYRYSSREGTPAALMEHQVPPAIAKRRLSELLARQREIRSEILQGNIGQRRRVLVERRSKHLKEEFLGRDDFNEMVLVQASEREIGQFLSVELNGLRGLTLVGRRV